MGAIEESKGIIQTGFSGLGPSDTSLVMGSETLHQLRPKGLSAFQPNPNECSSSTPGGVTCTESCSTPTSHPYSCIPRYHQSSNTKRSTREKGKKKNSNASQKTKSKQANVPEIKTVQQIHKTTAR
jgi:hypothetical protein